MSRQSLYNFYYADKIIELGNQGKSKTQMASACGISVTRMKQWIKEYPEFREAYELARTHAQCYHEDILVKGLKGAIPHFNAPACLFLLKNQFGDDYREVTEQKIDLTSDTKTMTDDEIDSALAKLNMFVTAPNTDNHNPGSEELH